MDQQFNSNIFLSQGIPTGFPYQPAGLALNPFAKNVPSRKITLKGHPFIPRIPSVVKLYDPLTGNVKAVVDPMGNGPIMNEEDYKNSGPQYQIPNQLTPQFPQQVVLVNPTQQYLNQGDTIFRQLQQPQQQNNVQQNNAPFDKIPIKKQTAIVNANNNDLVDLMSDMPIGSDLKNLTIVDNSWQLIQNPLLKNKILLKEKTGGQKTFSGSGIILFEKINGKTTIILVKSKRGVFEEFGGEISKDVELNKDVLKNNAIKETIEESQGVFSIQTDLNSKNGEKDRFVDINDANGFAYRCYFLTLTYGSDFPNLSQLFMKNKSVINNYGLLNNLGIDWYETFEIGRFDLTSLFDPISKLSEEQLNNDVYIFDVKGNQTNMKLRSRTAKALLKLYNSGSNNDVFKHILNNNIISAITTYNANNGITYITV